MENYLDLATIKLQIILNKKMYEIGKVSYNTYSRTNEILISRLTCANEDDMIIHSESKQLGG